MPTARLKITKENAEFQVLKALKTNREKRNHEGFLFEGVRSVNNAIKNGWKIKAFLFSTEKGLSQWAMDILKNSTAAIHYDLSEKLLADLSDKEETSELVVLAEIPKDDIAKIPLTKNPLIVVFDRPSNPGNLGTIIRTCDALGVDGLIVTGHATDVFDPETIRATTGSLFSFPIVRLPSQKELTPWLEEMKKKYSDLQIVGTDEKGTETIYEHDFKKPAVLLAGNEKLGLSSGYKAIVTSMVKIPMQSSADSGASSLNVAVATSIVVAEVGRQRAI